MLHEVLAEDPVPHRGPDGSLLDLVRACTRSRERLVATARRQTEALGNLVAEFRPDGAVFDPFMLPYQPALGATGVPCVALSTKPPLHTDMTVPPYTSGHVPRPGRIGQVGVRSTWAVQRARYGIHRSLERTRRLAFGADNDAHFAALSAESGVRWYDVRVDRRVPYDLRLSDVPELVLMAREFDLPRPDGASQPTYIGPCVDVERSEPTFDWSWRRSSARLAYCSLSTVPKQQLPARTELRRRIGAAFAGSDRWDLLMVAEPGTVGPFVDADNVKVVGWAPQIEALRAADVHISHCGHNGLKEAIRCNTAVVAYPLRADQPGNAARVVAHRVGVLGHRRDRPADVLDRAERVVADPAIRRRVAEMHATFARLDRSDAAVGSVLAALGLG
ncbi:MAG: glycosyltransferase family 1 protein [bacterium]|nr:glycosyltransferase family 1 protein [bacterium]